MQNIVKLIFALSVLVIAPATFSADTSNCLGCHSEDQLGSMSVDDISVAVRDANIPPHKSFDALSDDELQAIAKELSDDC